MPFLLYSFSSASHNAFPGSCSRLWLRSLSLQPAACSIHFPEPLVLSVSFNLSSCLIFIHIFTPFPHSHSSYYRASHTTAFVTNFQDKPMPVIKQACQIPRSALINPRALTVPAFTAFTAFPAFTARPIRSPRVIRRKPFAASQGLARTCRH